MKRFFLFLFITYFIYSCKKDKPPIKNDDNNTVPITLGQELNGVFICNEGNFNSGNASISYLNEQNQFITDIFQSQNNFSLGDIVQSINYFNGSYYIIVNNSGKIVVVGSTDFKQKAVITGLTSPRYMVIKGTTGYVSDLYANKISIINLDNNSISGQIYCSGWTEEMQLIGNEIYVTNLRRNKIYVINTDNNQITDSITVSQATSGIVKDKNGMLWVLCGDAANNAPSKLGKINPSTKTLAALFTFPSGIYASKIKINGTGDALFMLDNSGVKKLRVSDLNLPSTNVISGNNRNFYQIGIDPITERIYVSDAIDYVQRGFLFRYDPQGFSIIDSFKTGIIPGYIFFKK